VDEVLQMVALYESCYSGWTAKHFYERWQAEHGGTRSSRPRRGAYRKKATAQALAWHDAPSRRLDP
jgi:hypothetical protein